MVYDQTVTAFGPDEARKLTLGMLKAALMEGNQAAVRGYLAGAQKDGEDPEALLAEAKQQLESNSNWFRKPRPTEPPPPPSTLP